MPGVLRTLLAPCMALALTARASDSPSTPSLQKEGFREAKDNGHTSSRRTTHAAGSETLSRVQHLIEAAGSNVFLLDLNSLSRGVQISGDSGAQDGSREARPPWFEGFVTSGSEATARAATAEVVVAAVAVGHPIRRMLSYFREEAIELDTSLFWVEDEGSTSNHSTAYPQDYQLVDNYLVRVLAGKSAWELPPGGVGAAELTAARIVLGKFEVILREECISTDISLLMPYLETVDAAAEKSSWDGLGFPEPQELSLPLGSAGRRLVRANWWDLQLWDFVNRLVMSRSTTAESYLCGSTRRERTQNTLGAGRRAVVYNSPNFHLTSVSMFSCVLMSWGYQVTAVLKKPVEGFQQLLPCAHDVIVLRVPELPSDEPGHKRERIAMNSTTAGRLGLSLSTQSDSGVGFDGDEAEGPGAAATGARGRGPFDVSVLCTAYLDLWALFNPGHNELDARLAVPLLWDVNVSIWNLHGVSRGFENGGMPPASHDFAAGIPSINGKKPPATFLTVYGEQVERWEALLEEAYEGWGPKTIRQEKGLVRNSVSSLRGLFPHPGVVYPILPTGGMRIPRPTTGSVSSDNDGNASEEGTRTLGETRRVGFVVQGIMVSTRRDYKSLLACLEAMCVNGKDNFSLDAVGSSGDLTEELEAHPCVASRYTEGLHLDYNDFYARISQGDFVVTAAAVDDYEYDRATSSVPTALLLEKPLVMASSLLHAYPCLWNSRIHSMVANDDLCLNLQAAYDLTPSEYDKMELEARDCKLAMWKQTRETVAELVLKGRVSSYS